MFDTNLFRKLCGEIVDFIRTYGVVSHRQILSFFSPFGDEEVENALKSLVSHSVIFEYGMGHYSSMRLKKYLPDRSYADQGRCLDVLCSVPCDSVTQYYTGIYPTMAAFVSDGELYDITVFQKEDWQSRLMLASRLRKQSLLPGVQDSVRHIAVVPNTDLIAPIGKALPFASYVIVDSQTGAVESYELD